MEVHVLPLTRVLLLLLLLLMRWSAAEEVLATVDMEVDLSLDATHPCYRNCSAHSPAMVCRYNFKAEEYTIFSKACYNCPRPASDCKRRHCVAADGVKKPIMTINRRLPGPTIQVCLGDEIIVDLNNQFLSDSTSIHWHGLHMVGTPYMDGVARLTQCPIDTGTVFRYHFLAAQTGTHYWHSHSGVQRADGLYGVIAIRSPADPLLPLYDVDDHAHILMISDWLETLAIQKFVFHHHSEHDNKPFNILVNGHGYVNSSFVYRDKHPPLSALTVKKGLRHRLRSISNSIQNCPIEVSIDGHELLLIAKDGAPLSPIIVDSFVIYGGERWDFVVEANKAVGNYWIKFHGLLDCDNRFLSAHQVAVLRYEGAPDALPGPISDVTWQSTKREGFQVNTLNKAPGNANFKTAAEIHSKYDNRNYSGPPDHVFWLSYDFNPINTDLYNNAKYYPFFGVPPKYRLYMPQMNHISLRLPATPPLSQPEDVPASLYCNSSSPPNNNCTHELCYCLNTINVEKNSLVELVLVDEGVTYYANHPFHLHGHDFAVLAMGRLGEQTTLGAVKALDAQGKFHRNFEHPAIMDTVTVPDGGYTVLRFRATNPGYWLFHCHITFHVEVGMGLVIKVGDQSMIPPVPDKFPRCGMFQPPRKTDLKSCILQWLNGQGDSCNAASILGLPSVAGSNSSSGFSTVGNCLY